VHTIENLKGISQTTMIHNRAVSSTENHLISEMSNDVILQQRERSSSFFEETHAKRQWIKLSNVFRGISLLKKSVVKTIEDPDEIPEEINRSPRKFKSTLMSTSSWNPTKQALDDVRLYDRFYDLVSRGHKKDIAKLKVELERDPRKYMRDRKDPEHLINKKNRLKQTPIYVACKHGNFEMVQFLLTEQADPHILSNVADNEKENILQVTARWKHIKVFDYLMENVEWSKEEIKAVARSKGNSPEINRMIAVYSKAKFGFCFNCCLFI